MPTPYSATRLLAELPRLRRYARILTDDPERADRLVEETLARARRMQAERNAPATPDTRLIALLRAVSAESVDARPSAVPRAAAASAQSRSDRGAEMLAQLRELPLEQREVLVLVAVERLSYAQVADLLATPVATVISRLSQAREALRTRAAKPQSTPHSR